MVFTCNEKVSILLVLWSPTTRIIHVSEFKWWILLCTIGLSWGGSLISLCLQSVPMMMIFCKRSYSLMFLEDGLLYWPPGRSLCDPFQLIISFLETLSLQMCYLPRKARHLPTEVCGLSCEVSYLDHLSFDFFLFFSSRKSLQVPPAELVHHIAPAALWIIMLRIVLLSSYSPT